MNAATAGASPNANANAVAPDARRVGLWVFMAVVCSLFMLFSIAYVMRMAMADWQPLRYVPWQLWLSTAMLVAASAAWEAARRSAARRMARLACVLSLLFLAVQLWAWQAMTAMNFTVNGNPASSFFYLLTGLHGLHVVGGLVAAVLAAVLAGNGSRGGMESKAGTGTAARAEVRAGMLLCARYWHFLLLLWLALFALLFLVTPDFVQVVCESVGIRPPQAR
ncbi:bb3-type cytochrome oxidase subunit III [Pseudoduganella sp. LjRoot289]|uniref:bb3-type cytochrome oxidase subunit III n=1 Tax=Pseudoduganella sp. LjRoot289 TaxID=3342314 RepID=UPI003ECFD816